MFMIYAENQFRMQNAQIRYPFRSLFTVDIQFVNSYSHNWNTIMFNCTVKLFSLLS